MTSSPKVNIMDKDTLNSITEIITSSDKMEAIKNIVSDMDKDKLASVIDNAGEIVKIIPEEHQSSVKGFIFGLVEKFVNKGP